MSVKADSNTCESEFVELTLEAMPLKKTEFEKMSQEAKGVMKSGAARTFQLWSTAAHWYRPALSWNINTTPGVFIKDGTILTDPLLRYAVSYALEMSRRGGYTDGSDWLGYIEAFTLFLHRALFLSDLSSLRPKETRLQLKVQF